MLEIKDLNVFIDEKNILKDINLKINEGEMHVLMGPNGVGKSTISKVIMGTDNYKVSGDVLYNNENLLEMSITDRAKKGIYLVNQNPIAIEGVSNAEMLRTVLQERTNERINIFDFNKELENICKRLELDKSFIHKSINVGCSGGERKKIELMHLWMLKPKFIILDEIDSGLDVDAVEVVVKNIKDYYEEYHPTILIITHEERFIKYFDKYYVHVLSNKTIVDNGDEQLAKEILNNGFKKYGEANEVVRSEEHE